MKEVIRPPTHSPTSHPPLNHSSSTHSARTQTLSVEPRLYRVARSSQRELSLTLTHTKNHGQKYKKHGARYSSKLS